MLSCGLLPPEEMLADGEIHRFPTNGRGQKDGWYVVFADDGPAAGAFGDWKTDLKEKWCSKSDDQLSPEEVRQMRQRMARAVKMRQAEEAKDRAAAALEARALWETMPPAPADHGYLRRKGVEPNGARLAPDGRLAVPLMDAAGAVHSLEFIAPDGKKLFLAGGRKKGLFFLLGQPGPVLCVAEGFATAASVHEASELPVAVAFDCGNLEPVSAALRKAWPGTRLVLCADDDWRTDRNPGLTAARKAAAACGGVVAVPVFGADRDEKDTDFNDLCRLEGPVAARSCVESAVAALPAAGGASAWTDEEPPPHTDEDAPAGKRVPVEARIVSAARESAAAATWLGALAGRYRQDEFVGPLVAGSGHEQAYRIGLETASNGLIIGRPGDVSATDGKSITTEIARRSKAAAARAKTAEAKDGALVGLGIEKLVRHAAMDRVAFDVTLRYRQKSITLLWLESADLAAYRIVRNRALDFCVLLPPAGKGASGAWYEMLEAALETVQEIAPDPEELSVSAIREEMARILETAVDSEPDEALADVRRGIPVLLEGIVYILPQSMIRRIRTTLKEDLPSRKDILTAARALHVSESRPRWSETERPRLWAFPARRGESDADHDRQPRDEASGSLFGE
mgnify:CR=1 FL=1